MTEKYTLNWDTFATRSTELLSELYSTSSFSDVTLVCNGQTQFKAHKFVLSACSSVFRNIFSDNISSPYVYLRGINKEEMDSLLQFMYIGQTTLCHDRLNEFLNVAKELDVQEIGQNVDTDDKAFLISSSKSEAQHNASSQYKAVYSRGMRPRRRRNKS